MIRSCCLCSALKWCSTRVLEELRSNHLSFLLLIILWELQMCASVEKPTYTLKVSLCTNPYEQTSVGFWQTMALLTQQKLMLDLPAEECAVHNEFWYGAYDCKTHWQNLTRLRFMLIHCCLRNQMFSCSWCWSWFAIVWLETEQHLQPKAHGQTGPFKMRFQKYAGLIYQW